MPIVQRITPCLWFDGKAEEAANHYVSIFENSRITSLSRYGDTGPGRKGSVMVVGFDLDGQAFTALNGGPMFTFTPAISMMVNCETQAEVDRYWDALGDGGRPGRCGWLEDRFGVSWQIVPTALAAILREADSATSQQVMGALMGMTKLDIAGLKQACDA